GIFLGFLRRRSFCDEGCFARHGTRALAANVSQLVPAPVSVCVCDVPLRKRCEMRRAPTLLPRSLNPDETAASRFAADVQYYLLQDPRQLPSHYLYDALGSALFDAICRLPWYRIT